MDELLVNANLAHLIDRFREERIEPEIVEEMRDEELIRLGVSTIGERIRLRNLCRNTAVNEGASTSGSQSVASSVLQERISVFGSRARGRGARGRQGKRGGERPRTWTAQFVCVADRHQTRIPTSIEKQILHQAGLGLKKIKLEATDDEAQVLQKITSDKTNENGQVVGFPQLKNCGGFEILHCVSNCKDLTPVTCSWAVQDLKANLGAQSKLYLRPIQKSLSTRSLVPNNTSQVKEKCISCQREFLIRELRPHIYACRMRNAAVVTSESDEDPLPPFNLNESETDRAVPDGLSVLPDDDPPAVQSPRPDIQPGGSQPEVIDIDHENNDNEDSNSTSLDDVVRQVIDYCKENNVSDAVEILRYTQKRVLTGRQLDIVDVGESVEGNTNFIIVDRQNLLATAFEELDAIEDFRLTLQVQFYGEEAEDFGGPRKEFFCLALSEIQDKYFSNGLKDHISEDYFKVGLIMGLSMLQNGKIPKFLPEEMVVDIFQNPDPTSSAIACLQRGLQATGILHIGRSFPIFLHLFRESPANALTLRKLTTLLKPSFSETGSNKRRFENEVYAAFCKYLREAASGRRGNITLGHVLQFATGADEEPMLGFILHPSISFFEAESSFLPVANTCINTLRLPCGSSSNAIPARDKLFELYDYAFSNSFFGNT